MTDKTKTPGAMVMVERELLCRLQERLDCHMDARDWNLICNAIYKPAEQTPAVGGEPRALAYLVDPGAGSAMDHLQKQAPSVDQICDMAKRGGSFVELIDRAHIAPLLAEIERLKAVVEDAARLLDEQSDQLYKKRMLIAELEAQQGEPVAWVNGEQLSLCIRSPLDIGHSNPIYHELPRNIAGSALRTDYCNTPLYRQARHG